MTKNQKTLVVIAAVIVLIMGLAWLATAHHQAPITPKLPTKMKINGTYLVKGNTLQPFTLTDNHGHNFSEENLKGHWSMLFFGFTNCGYVCPTSMAALGKMAKLLQVDLPNSQQPKVVMVSVDPARDSVSRMNEYVTTFNKHFIGLRGSNASTLALQRQLNIVAVKMQSKHRHSKHYAISHSAEVIVLSPDLEVKAFLSFPHQAKQMAHDYKMIIKAST